MTVTYRDKYRAIGLKIMFFRRTKGISQLELAELSDISVGYIGKIERGEAKPSLDVYWRVAAALDVKFEELCKEN